MRPISCFHLGIKEFYSLLRDPVMLFLVFYVFTISIYTRTTAIPETLNKAPIAIVDEDRSPLSFRLINAFYPPYFLPPIIIDHAEMDARMDAGLDTFALNIPPEFQQDVLANRFPAVQLNVDATRMSQAFTGSSYIQTIITDEVKEFVQRYRDNDPMPVDLALRVRFNPQLYKSWFAAITGVINEVTMLSIVLTGAALIREREHGTVEHLLVMPVTPLEIMVSKIWSMGLVVLISATSSLVFVIKGWLNIPIMGSIWLFVLGCAIHLFATTSLGIFLATIARSMPQFGMLMILVLLPMQMLSGGTTPRESMPVAVQYIMLAAPNTHFVMLAQTILFRGGGFSFIWPQFASLLLIGSILFLISLRRFRRTIETMA